MMNPEKNQISLLEYHMKCYEGNRTIFDQEDENESKFSKARQRLKQKINCVKFNSSLDNIVQNITNYEGYI